MADVPPGVSKNFEDARRRLFLSPQEQYAYQRHLHNLWTDDGYTHPDGGRSTYFMTPYEYNGRVYALPGVGEGRIWSKQESIDRAQQEGLDNFPSYASRAELNARYGKMHEAMEKDTSDWEQVRDPEPYRESEAVMPAMKTDAPRFAGGGPVEPPRTADPDKRSYEDYRLRYAVDKGEGEQFMDDVRRGPPYTSRGFAIGNNEGRIERGVPRFQEGGEVAAPHDPDMAERVVHELTYGGGTEGGFGSDPVESTYISPGGERRAGETINRQTQFPPILPSAEYEITMRGEDDRKKRADDLAATQEREGQALQTSAPYQETWGRPPTAIRTRDELARRNREASIPPGVPAHRQLQQDRERSEAVVTRPPAERGLPVPKRPSTPLPWRGTEYPTTMSTESYGPNQPAPPEPPQPELDPEGRPIDPTVRPGVQRSETGSTWGAPGSGQAIDTGTPDSRLRSMADTAVNTVKGAARAAVDFADRNMPQDLRTIGNKVAANVRDMAPAASPAARAQSVAPPAAPPAPRTAQPNQTPQPATAAPPVATPTVPPTNNGPLTSGNNTPGGYGNSQPAPPVVQGSTTPPVQLPVTTQPPGVPPLPRPEPPPAPVPAAPAPPAAAPPQTALNVAPPPVPAAPGPAPAPAPQPPRPTPGVRPRLGLEDQQRAEAYDSIKDANDPHNVLGVDANGMIYRKSDVGQLIQGAASVAQKNPDGSQPVLGHGSVSPQAFDRYVEKKAGLLPGNIPFTKGEALLAGMVSDYRLLLSQGRVQEANNMAYGLIQAANIEAAASGMAAYQLYQRGDYKGALQKFVNGANLFPDGINLSVESDGRTITARRPDGTITAQVAVTPQQVLAGIMGLQDGSLFWQSLHTAADQLNKDKNATGRALSNEIRKRQIVLLDKKIAAPAKATGAAAPSTAYTQFSQGMASIPGAPRPQGGGNVYITQGGGENDDYLLRGDLGGSVEQEQ